MLPVITYNIGRARLSGSAEAAIKTVPWPTRSVRRPLMEFSNSFLFRTEQDETGRTKTRPKREAGGGVIT